MAATRSGVPLAMENVFVAQRRSCVSSDASRQFGIDEGQYLLAGRDQPFVTTWLHMQALLGDEPRHILDVDDPLVRVALEQWAAEPELDGPPLEFGAARMMVRVPLQTDGGLG